MYDLHPGRGWRLLLTAAALTLALRAADSPGDGRPAAATRMPAQDTTPRLVALGDSIFHGRAAGGMCFSCHGMDGRGVKGLGPDLTDGTWLHGDGSVEFLEAIVRSGVLAPKKSAAMMPQFGGAPLDQRQLRAVALYVHSIQRVAR
jgi:mono/diheme cytochrome c family protein